MNNKRKRNSTAASGGSSPGSSKTTLPDASGRAASKPLRFLVVDDHAIVRDGLAEILLRSFREAVLGQAANAAQALDQTQKAEWDVILLDISMPGQSGLDVIKQICAFVPKAKVLVLSMHPEDQYALRVLKAGASGYITKETASVEVVGAITRVLGGGKYVSSQLTDKLVDRLKEPLAQAPHETLSDREYQIMRMIAAGRSVKEIGFDLKLSVKTVSTYRARVLQKLSLTSNAHIIRYALREKLVH